MPLFKKTNNQDNENIKKEVRYIMVQTTPWYQWVKTIFGFLILILIISSLFSNFDEIETQKEERSDYNKVFLNLGSTEDKEKTNENYQIGYLDLNGTIMSSTMNEGLSVSSSIILEEEVVPVLKLFTQDDDIKSVVLRINSPGGAVGPSQIIGDYVKILAAKKPVYVYSDELLASGGYWISAPATKIYSYKGALVGSIGVISQVVNVEKLLSEKLGVDIKTYKAGIYKDIGSYNRATSPEEDALLQNMVNSSYNDFIAWVAENRKISSEEVQKLATGWVYTGKQALANKLLDGNGLFEDFLADMQKDLDIQANMQFVTYERPKSFIEELTSSTSLLGAKSDLKIFSQLEGNFILPSGIYYLWR